MRNDAQLIDPSGPILLGNIFTNSINNIGLDTSMI
jgi:hypothetical protein